MTNVGDTLHADSLALFALNIDILLADQSKPEQSVEHFDFDLTFDIIDDIDPGHIFYIVRKNSRT